MKVCFATEDFYPSFIGGQGIYGKEIVLQLAGKGHSVTVLAEKRSGRLEFWKERKGIRVFLVPFCFGNQLILALLEYLFFILRLRKESFDILHANQLSGLFFVLFKPRNVGKIIISEWNTHFEMQKYTRSLTKKILYQVLIVLEKILYSRTDAMIFDSSAEQKNFQEFLKLEKIPHAAIFLGSEKAVFSNQEKREARKSVRKHLKIGHEAKIVLFIGRLVERKRVDTLLKALDFLKRQSVYGVIVGDGPERKKLERVAPSNALFIGRDLNPRAYYLASDVFVTVSVAEGGFLLSALDAASFGLPLILSPSAAGFPIVKNGVNGYITDSKNPKEIAKKILQVLDNSRKMGEGSRRIAQTFTWDSCVKKTIRFYAQLLEKS